jgi:branched-chain amino acid transport system permease protein
LRFLFKTGYEQDVRLFKHGGQVFSYGLLALLLVTAPWWAGDYAMTQLHFICIYAIVGFGLMMLVGFTGQISLGHAAFLAVGAYTEALMQAAGVPFVISISCAALFSAAAGIIVGLPALRLKGIYLAIATLAFNVIVEEIITRWESLTGGNSGKHLKPVELFGMKLDDDASFYYLCLVLTVLCGLACVNLLRSPTGRAFVAIRDSEISASCLGVNLARYKTTSFAFSAALTGVGGRPLRAQARVHLAGAVHAVRLDRAGDDRDPRRHRLPARCGARLGVHHRAAAADLDREGLAARGTRADRLQAVVFGVILILFIIFEPLGLYGRWLKVRTWFELFPFYRRGMFRRQKSYMKSERLR